MKDALGRVDSVLVLGGGSDIGLATARALVSRGARTVGLAARKPDALQEQAEELRRLGARSVILAEFDADDVGTHASFVADAFDRLGEVDVVLMAVGVLGDQRSAERDPELAAATLHTNFVGPAAVLLPVAGRLCEQGHGTIVVLSSVAGERARKSNFVYGSSKAGLDAFCQGLGDRLADSGVRVMIVRPGFVHTKMTEGLRAAPFDTTAPETARAIVEGIRRDAELVWVPPTLRWVMMVLRHLPRPVFRRLPI